MGTRPSRGGSAAIALGALLAVVSHPLSACADGKTAQETLTLETLIALPEDDLAQVDIATMNLACAQGLPGSEQIDNRTISCQAR